MTQELKYYYLCGGAEFGLNYYTGAVVSSLPVYKIKRLVKKKYSDLRHLGAEIPDYAIKYVSKNDMVFL